MVTVSAARFQRCYEPEERLEVAVAALGPYARSGFAPHGSERRKAALRRLGALGLEV